MTVADVAPEDDMTGHYPQYETSEELWGHEVRLTRDSVPGRLYYVEDEQWHDAELFEKSGLPCG